MRTAAAAGAIAMAIVPQPDTGAVHTIPQRDLWRTAHEATSASVAAEGRYVAFATFARLDPADTDAQLDIYVVDRTTGQLWFESPPSTDEIHGTENRHPRLSADGRLLVYERLIDNGGQIVLRDRLRAAVTLIPPVADRSSFSSNPEISRDGGVVVFSSTANLVQGEDANGLGQDVYLFDRMKNAVERISVDVNGGQSPTGVSVGGTVSGDGRFVAFASSGNLSAIASPSVAVHRRWHEVYVFDRQNKILRLISRGRNGEPADGASWSPALSGDGRSVAFVSNATNLVPSDRNRSMDVFVSDLVTGRIELVSRTSAGAAANGRSTVPAISDDGQVVAFQSEASDMLCDRRCTAASEDINLLWDVFVRDRRDGTIRRVSRDAGREWMEPSEGPAIDASGRVVVFSSKHPIDAADTRNDFDLFICAPRLAGP